MDLQLGDEHRMIRDMARDFAQKEIAPIAAHFDNPVRCLLCTAFLDFPYVGHTSGVARLWESHTLMNVGN